MTEREVQINGARTVLLENLITEAQAALDNEEWILCATLCRTIEEMKIGLIVRHGAQAAWDTAKDTAEWKRRFEASLTGPTVVVPLLGQTREEHPRTGEGAVTPIGDALEATSTLECRICGVVVASVAMPAHMDAAHDLYGWTGYDVQDSDA